MRSVAILLLAMLCPLRAVTDSDRDGLDDALEQRLLTQFAPAFLISTGDCASLPAEFTDNQRDPKVRAENGTIYGQVFPARRSNGRIEIHYYHLWSRDCGRMGHSLDSEHVSVLLDGADRKALEWYAAAHEDTICDASQIVPAAELGAVDTGATVWISAGKHASFLKRDLCGRGCGGDRCTNPVRVAAAKIINLGESGNPMNGADWALSPRWPLAAKMQRSDFPALGAAAVQAREWPSARAVISAGNSSIDATSGALVISSARTDTAMARSEDETGQALALSYRKVKHAVGASRSAVQRALKP